MSSLVADRERVVAALRCVRFQEGLLSTQCRIAQAFQFLYRSSLALVIPTDDILTLSIMIDRCRTFYMRQIAELRPKLWRHFQRPHRGTEHSAETHGTAGRIYRRVQRKLGSRHINFSLQVANEVGPCLFTTCSGKPRGTTSVAYGRYKELII